MLAYFHYYYFLYNTWDIMHTRTKSQINQKIFTQTRSSESLEICPALVKLITRILGNLQRNVRKKFISPSKNTEQR